MSASSSSKPPSKHTTRGSSREENKSKGMDSRQKNPPTASQPQSIDQQFAEDVQDTQNRRSGDGESPLINRGNGDVQRRKSESRVTPGRSIQQKRPPIVPGPQSVTQQFTGVVRDTKSRGAGRRESPLIRKTGTGANPDHPAQRKTPPTASRPRSVSRPLTDDQDTKSSEAEHEELPSIDHADGDTQRKTGAEANPGRSVQRKEISATSQIQSVVRRIDDIRDTQSRRARGAGSSSNNRGSRDVQSPKTSSAVTPNRPIQQKISPITSRLQSVGRRTESVRDTQSRGEGSSSTNRGRSDVQSRKTSSGVTSDRPVQKKITAIPSRLQPVGRRTDDVRDTESRVAKGGESSSSGSRNAQSRKTSSGVTPDRPIQQNISPIPSRLRSLSQRTDDVRDSESRGAKSGGSSLINRGSKGVESRKTSSDVTPDRPIQQNISPIPSQIRSVGRRSAGDVRDMRSKEAGPTEPSLTDRQGGDTQRRMVESRVNPDDSIQIEVPNTKEASITMLQGASNFQITDANFMAVGGDATIIRFGDGNFTDVQKDLIGDYIATLAALPDITDNVKKHILNQLIINLPRAEAVFNDYQTKKKSGPCFEGTRVALLREMANWVTGHDESRMYILSGLAGIGKSTVAYTVASRAADLNLLGASFFFSRDEADRNNAKKLFTTIAYQLCVYNEQFAKAVGDALQTERASTATTKDPQEQLQALILDPLRSTAQSRARPILVIVDALDECCEDDVRAVVQGLGRLVRELPSFKVILTTRPHPYIDYFLNNQDGHTLFHLQDIEDKVVDTDIRLYLKYNLSLEKVQERFPRRRWCASDEQIDSLVCAAGRLFIIAATSVRYILDKFASNPAGQMQELLRAGAQDHTPFKDLDQFYTVILRNAVPVDCDNYNTISRYQSVVGAIIFVQRPLPVPVLAHLIDIDVDEIHAVLDNLQSVILLGDDDIPRVYHKSFPDYFTDKARCKDSKLQIDPTIRHTQIATCCFEITNNHLKYNILDLGTPARFMSNQDGLDKDGITDEQIEAKISPHLRYACVYWAAHFELANIEDDDILNGSNKFVNRHLLHWLEVLSLIGKLDSAHRAIRGVLKILTPTSSDLYRLLSDALRFISKFYDVINRSALHTYYSALPFSPTDSLLFSRYIKEVKYGVCNIEGGPVKWDALVAETSHGEQVDVVKFSLNSTLFVSYSNKFVEGHEPKQGMLKIWDTFTGTPISTIPGHTFAISSDFSTIASSQNNIITYYGLDGSATGNMITTSSTIQRLALSSENNRVSAALSDGTVYLWDSRRGKLIDSFDEDNGYWKGLQFSSSGTRLVYTSVDGIVRLRDGINGRLVADLQCGSDNGLEFSADSSRIASLSDDHGLTLWNSESGRLIGEVEVVGHWQLAISANGSLLATADEDNVTLWSENCGQLMEIKVLESQLTCSIAFSPENMLAIRDYDSIKIYNTETQAMSMLLSSGLGGPMAYSPDGTRLACGTLLCDALAIDTSCSPSRELESRCTALALSRNCSQLACGFQDGTIELWETIPTMRRVVSQTYSSGPRGIVFGPDSRLFASSLLGLTTELQNGGNGPSFEPKASKSSLLVVGESNATLLDPDTLNLLHTFTLDKYAFGASISDEGDIAAIIFNDDSVNIYDLKNRTTTCIAKIEIPCFDLQGLTFLPDKSHLVVQSLDGNFLSLNLVNKYTTMGPMLEHLLQLPNIPLLHGAPIWLCQTNGQRYIATLFSQDQSPVPLLWIPIDIQVEKWTQGSSMIALGCEDGRIILLRLRTSHID